MANVDLATEGDLDEAVLRRLIQLKAPRLIAGRCLGKMELIVSLARRSGRRLIKEEMVPPRDSTSSIGPNYIGLLMNFVASHWDVDDAARRSDSLRQAIAALSRYQPVLPWSQDL